MLAGGRCAVMAGRAAAHDQRVIYTGYRCPAAGAVAVLATVRGLNMSGRFTCRYAAVVAADTVARHLAMVKARALPATGGVAVLAIVAAIYVISGFSRRSAPVVA